MAKYDHSPKKESFSHKITLYITSTDAAALKKAEEETGNTPNTILRAALSDWFAKHGFKREGAQ